MQLNIRDNRERSRFEAEVGGETAVADYRLSGGTIEFTHTEVPAEARGEGVADQLAHAALDSARERHLRVIASCHFIASYIERHAEYQDLLAGD